MELFSATSSLVREGARGAVRGRAVAVVDRRLEAGGQAQRARERARGLDADADEAGVDRARGGDVVEDGRRLLADRRDRLRREGAVVLHELPDRGRVRLDLRVHLVDHGEPVVPERVRLVEAGARDRRLERLRVLDAERRDRRPALLDEEVQAARERDLVLGRVDVVDRLVADHALEGRLDLLDRDVLDAVDDDEVLADHDGDEAGRAGAVGLGRAADRRRDAQVVEGDRVRLHVRARAEAEGPLEELLLHRAEGDRVVLLALAALRLPVVPAVALLAVALDDGLDRGLDRGLGEGELHDLAEHLLHRDDAVEDHAVPAEPLGDRRRRHVDADVRVRRGRDGAGLVLAVRVEARLGAELVVVDVDVALAHGRLHHGQRGREAEERDVAGQAAGQAARVVVTHPGQRVHDGTAVRVEATEAAVVAVLTEHEEPLRFYRVLSSLNPNRYLGKQPGTVHCGSLVNGTMPIPNPDEVTIAIVHFVGAGE